MFEFTAHSMEEVMDIMEKRYGEQWHDQYSLKTNIVEGGFIKAKVMPLHSSHVDWNEIDELVEKEVIIEDEELEETYEELMSEFSETKIEVSVDSDEMKAYLSVYPGSLKEEITYSMLKEKLEQAGVVFGVDEKKLKQLTQIVLQEAIEDIVIAKGKSPTQSKDSQLKFLFPKDGFIIQKDPEKGKINYAKRRKIFQCQPDDVLVKKYPGTQGEEGTTVTGKSISSKPFRDINLKQLIGNNHTIQLSEDKNSLIALKKGQPYLTQVGKIHIREVYIVNKSLDYSVGDIVFDGTVIIHGDVEVPFEVHAKGDILIEGVVRDTRIFSEGFINIIGGAFGKGNGLIDSKKSIMAKFLNNINVFAEENVISNDYIINSKVYSGRNIVIHGRSTVSGGVLMAKSNVSVKIAGNIGGVKTLIGCGVDYHKVKEAEKRNLKLSEFLKKVMKISRGIEDLKTKLKETTEKKEQIRLTKKIAKLKIAKKKYYTMIQNMKNKHEERQNVKEKETSKNSKPTIYITEHAYQGVTIQIYAEKIKLNSEIGPTRFRYGLGSQKIEAKPYGKWNI